jgi:preprotein translocase SecE subunit
MAKSRAQRKAERRAREARAQHDTQVPVSGDVAEVEAVETGVNAKQLKEAEKRQREDQKRREREQIAKRQKQAQAAPRQRGGVIGFLVSCWAELRKVQWPDRDTLVQATAVTIIFVAVAATYLGALDSAFSFLIKQIL